MNRSLEASFDVCDEEQKRPFSDDWYSDYYRQKHVDPIYGEIELLLCQQKIIATPEFNRLRDLKQMGEANYIFTNANHTRFSHSVGVAHLAKQLYRHLTMHSKENPYNENEEILVITAAMCHDIGHGPNSHAFELWAPTFDHEEMSVEILHNMLKKGSLAFLNFQTMFSGGIDENFKIVCAMISGVSHEDALKLVPRGKLWLFDIVHNKTHGIDVDKMDYLVRDTHSVFGSSHPHVRMSQIIDSMRIVNGSIRFNVLACQQLYELLYLRQSMHKNVYTHDSVFAVKYMFLDLLHYLDAQTNQAISKSIKDAEQFLLLSDSVFQPWATVRDGSASDDAKILWKRIQTQDHYVVVARKTVYQKPNVSVDRLFELLDDESSCPFDKNSLFITINRFDLGNGVGDPLQGKIFYYSSQHSDLVECTKGKEVSSCFYDNRRHTAEYLVRLFTKKQPENYPLSAWEKLCEAFLKAMQ